MQSQPLGIPNFTAAYTIRNFAQMGEIKMPTSDVALTVIKITPQMLQLDNQLAKEIHQLALNGLVGFSYMDSNAIQFRQDIAEKLQEVRQLRVYTHGNLQTSHTEEDFQVEGIDEKKYKAALKALHLITGGKSDEKAEKGEGKKKADKLASGIQHPHIGQPDERASGTSHKITRPRVARARSSQKTAVQQEYQHRETRAKEKKVSERERERGKIEREELKREDKNVGIRKKEMISSHQRESRNFGDEVETKEVRHRGRPRKVESGKLEKRKTPPASSENTVKRRKVK